MIYKKITKGENPSPSFRRVLPLKKGEIKITKEISLVIFLF